MKGYPGNIMNSLAFRIIMPVVAVFLLTGIGLYIFVLRSVSDFADRQIRETFSERARDVHSICDEGLNDLFRRGLAGDENALRIKKGLAIGLVEDFMRQNDLMGIITENGRDVLSVFISRGELQEISKRNVELNKVSSLVFGGKTYYLYTMHFEPWNWRIVLVKDGAGYSALIRRVRFAYAITGLALLAAALLIIAYLDSTIKRPISEIIVPLKKGETPVYRGSIMELAFISDNTGRMMNSLQEKTKWISHIYNIAVTRRGEEFFDEIVIAVKKIFNLNSFIARVNPDSETAMIFAHYLDGTLKRNITLPLRGSPCEGVKEKKQVVIIEEDAYKRFPLADSMNQVKADSYIGFPVFDRKGDVIGILNAFGEQREFTESDINLLQTIGQIVAAEFEFLEKEAEKERLIKQVIQEQKLESIGLLANGIAHNFNNILVGVLGYASLMRMRLEEAKVNAQPMGENLLDESLKYIDVIESSAQKASVLAAELASLAKGRPSGQLSGSSLDMNKLITDLRKLLVNTFPKNIRINTELAEGIPLIQGNASEMEQAILNICLNSKDAMHEGGGSLTLKTFHSVISGKNPYHPYLPPGSYVTTVVADTGKGMDQEELGRIFEPFFTTKPVDQGKGLGLSITHAIITAHNGYIGAESSPGGGSVFTIHLPAPE